MRVIHNNSINLLQDNGFDVSQINLTASEAISLGLALMETGLFLKQQQKERTNG